MSTINTIPAHPEHLAPRDLSQWRSTLMVAGCGSDLHVLVSPDGEQATIEGAPWGVPNGKVYAATARTVTVFDLSGDPADLRAVEDHAMALGISLATDPDGDGSVPAPVGALPEGVETTVIPNEIDDLGWIRILAARQGSDRQVQVYITEDCDTAYLLTVPATGEDGWKDTFGSNPAPVTRYAFPNGYTPEERAAVQHHALTLARS